MDSAPSANQWTAHNDKLEDVFAVRQLARATRKTYRGWILQFQNFAKDLDPEAVTAETAAAFLTNLAVERKVNASTQNQAFNALLFFFRHVLEKDFDQNVLTIRRGKGGKDRTVPIPQVLRDELQAHLRLVEEVFDADLAHEDFLGAFMPEGSYEILQVITIYQVNYFGCLDTADST